MAVLPQPRRRLQESELPEPKPGVRELCSLVAVCVRAGVWRSEGVPVGAGRMCRGHQRQRLAEGLRVSPGLSVRVSAVLCAFGRRVPPLARVGGSGSACFGVTSCFCMCVGVCIAGLWQGVMLSLVVSEQLSVVRLCASVSLYVRRVCKSGYPSRPWAWLGCAGAAGGDPTVRCGPLSPAPLSAAALPLAGRSAGPKEAWVGGLLAS